MPEEIFDRIKSIKDLYSCPACRSAYRFDSARFLGKMAGHDFFQMTCPDCSKPVLITVVQESPVIGGVESEKMPSPDREPISASEIAGFHLWISGTKSFTL
jgi:hypothetical protein